MTRQQRRIVRRIWAPATVLIVLAGAVVASSQASSSASGPTPATVVSTSPGASLSSSTSPSPTVVSTSPVVVPSPTTPPPPLLCGFSTRLCPIHMDYYAPLVDTTNPPDDTLCQQPWSRPTNATPPSPCHIDLRGVLYLPHNRTVPSSAKNQPLVIFVHGSTNNNAAPSDSSVAGMASFFTKQGFAFFALHRRGHGDSTGQNLDGVPLDPRDCVNGDNTADCDKSKIDNLCTQVFEVRQALIKMKSLRNAYRQLIIDPTRIALLGHSLGGIVTLCSNTQHLGLRTVIDIAGASENWRSYDATQDPPDDNQAPPISKLEQMVADHVTPPMFLQPMNDCSTRPTEYFGKTVADENEPYEATIFPDVTVNTTAPYGPAITDCSTAHPNFVFLGHWVNLWGPSVVTWIDRWFVDPSTIDTEQVPQN